MPQRTFSFLLLVSFFLFGAAEYRIFGQDVEETQSVIAVKVPVQVLKGGKPLRGLTAENFEIFDEDQPREISAFEVVDLEDLRAYEDLSYTDPDRQRRFLFFFDLYFSSPPHLRNAKEAVQEMLYDGMGLDDKIAVAVYAPEEGTILLTGFTSDEVLIESALDAVDWFMDPREYRHLTQDANRESTAAARADSYWWEDRFYVEGRGKTGLKLESRLELAREKLLIRGEGDQASIDLKEHLYQLANMKRIGSPRPQSKAVFSMLADLALLAHAIKVEEGGRYMVFLSEGFSNRLALAGGTGNMIQSHFERMLAVFRQTGWALHTIDVRGLRNQGRSGTHDSLYRLAEDTGGSFYRNYNDLGKAFETMVQNTGLTYILSFQPNDIEADGSFHEIRVKLKNVRGRARIQYARPGYFAPYNPSR